LARNLMRAAAQAVDDLGATLRRLGAPHLSLVGGFSTALRPFLPSSLTAHLRAPRLDALDGALIFAGCPTPFDAAAIP
jgi:glucosamine kinase